MKKKTGWKKTGICMVSVILMFLNCRAASALTDNQIINTLMQNKHLFETSSIFKNALRMVLWGLLFLFSEIGVAATRLYDTCFGFVDFTNYRPVNKFIVSFQPFFLAIICGSLFCLGLMLLFNPDKRPKFVINICLAVLVVSSSAFLINSLNGFIGSGIRQAIIGGAENDSSVYQIIGSNTQDLLYLDDKVGLTNLDKKTDGVKNSQLTYDEDFNWERFYNMDIYETVKPDDVKKDSQDIVGKKVITTYEGGQEKNKLKDIYDGVAWTDMLSEYYYRYQIDWAAAYMELLSVIIVYIFFSYKVIRMLFDIVAHRLLAYIYSANLAGGKKILKIFDSVKDCYISLLLTTVMIKLYLLACKFVGSWDVSGISKGFILLFISFAVVDGPNIVQQLTGIDIGISDGTGKAMSLLYGTSMVASAGQAAAGAAIGAGSMVGKAGKAAAGLASKIMPFQMADAQETAVPPSGKETDGSPLSDSRDEPEQQGEKDTGKTDGKISGMEKTDGLKNGNGRTDTGQTTGADSLKTGNGQTGNGQTDGKRTDAGEYSGETDENNGSGYREERGADGTMETDDIPGMESSPQDRLNGFDPDSSSGGIYPDRELEAMEQDLEKQENGYEGSYGQEQEKKGSMPGQAAGNLLNRQESFGGQQSLSKQPTSVGRISDGSAGQPTSVGGQSLSAALTGQDGQTRTERTGIAGNAAGSPEESRRQTERSLSKQTLRMQDEGADGRKE